MPQRYLQLINCKKLVLESGPLRTSAHANAVQSWTRRDVRTSVQVTRAWACTTNLYLFDNSIDTLVKADGPVSKCSNSLEGGGRDGSSKAGSGRVRGNATRGLPREYNTALTLLSTWVCDAWLSAPNAPLNARLQTISDRVERK